MARKSYPPYEIAKASAQHLKCRSRSHYKKVIEEQNIGYLPKFPNRVYKEWVSWNEYLGTNNSFLPKRGTWRPFWDAVKWAQAYCKKMNINSMGDWLRHFRSKQATLPNDIPLRPDQEYPEFKGTGWGTWCGTTIRGQQNAAKANRSVLVLAHSTDLHTPANFVYVLIFDTIHAAENHIKQHQDLRVYRVYHWEPTFRVKLDELLRTFGSEQGDNTYVVANINALLFELDNSLLWYTKQ
jgi:hypothetical protein